MSDGPMTVSDLQQAIDNIRKREQERPVYIVHPNDVCPICGKTAVEHKGGELSDHVALGSTLLSGSQ
jgi:hypothetical protein